jgi:hypothetical protein
MKSALAALVLLAGTSASAQSSPGIPVGGSGRITAAGVVRAQAVVDSVFLDRTATGGLIESGDWASYLMARLGVTPLPESSEMLVTTDSTGVVISGRIQDLPQEAREMVGPLLALVDSTTILAAHVVKVPAGKGLAHFRLRTVTVGGYPVPEMLLHSMLLRVGERYPALTRSGRDLLVQIPVDGTVTLETGAIRLGITPAGSATPP